jgi:hypothetical protein
MTQGVLGPRRAGSVLVHDGEQGGMVFSCRLRVWRYGQSKKDEKSLIKANYISVVEPPDTLPDLGLRHSRDLVHHQAARQMQTIVPVGLYKQSNERCIGLIGSESTDRDRSGRIEAIILYDHHGPWLSRIVVPP